MLDAANPAVLEVPAGYANGAMSLLAGTKLLYLSDAALDESLDDDVRFPARLWDPWSGSRALSVETSIVIPTLDHAATIGSTVERLNHVIAASGAARRGAGRRRRQSRRHARGRSAELADRYPLLHLRLLVQDREHSRLRHRPATGDGLRDRAILRRRDARRTRPARADPEDARRAALGRPPGAVLALRPRAPDVDAIPRRFAVYQSLYRRAIRVLLGVDIPDSTYGFRAFSRTFVQALGITGRRFAVCSEITFKVILAGGRTVRVEGAQTGPMMREQSRFRLGNELTGYAGTLARAALHRAGRALVLRHQ